MWLNFELNSTLSSVAAVIGPSFSSDVDVLSPLLTRQKKFLFSAGAASPTFSDKTLHPFHVRLATSSSFEGSAMIDLVEHLGYEPSPEPVQKVAG
mmetsp:Transcript_21668/g.33914  ORF Transcript_21668/g.33914 Transcript_21668/m.33914 type:complete len:95 (-) Transcript_21668:35-319(-)